MERHVWIQASTRAPGGWVGGRASAGAAVALLPRAAALLSLAALAAACATLPPAAPRSRGGTRSQQPPSALPVPVAGVAPASLQDNFGAPRSGGRRHEGIDIFAPRRTRVLAATEGYVAKLGNGGLGGITVTVVGPAGWRHYYAHLDSWGPVREGQWVQEGSLLGYVGNTGNARTTPPHLHYGIYPEGGGAINPYPLLRRGPGRPGTVIADRGGSEPEPPTRRTNPPARRIPAEVEEAARREAARWGARVLGEILDGLGDGN